MVCLAGVREFSNPHPKRVCVPYLGGFFSMRFCWLGRAGWHALSAAKGVLGRPPHALRCAQSVPPTKKNPPK
jgi:hypothetical protein